MSKEKLISVLELQTETDNFLNWVEERKMDGFIGSEIKSFRNIIEGCLENETFAEMLEKLKEQIRKWIRDLWNPTVIGKKYERHHNRSPRAKVLQQFPSILIGFLEVLSKVDQYELNQEEEEIFQQILIRIEVSILTLELKETEEKEPPEKEKKRRRTKPPRCNK